MPKIAIYQLADSLWHRFIILIAFLKESNYTYELEQKAFKIYLTIKKSKILSKNLKIIDKDEEKRDFSDADIMNIYDAIAVNFN